MKQAASIAFVIGAAFIISPVHEKAAAGRPSGVLLPNDYGPEHFPERRSPHVEMGVAGGKELEHTYDAQTGELLKIDD
ncbi:MAG: hypothetical protein LC131_07240 [Anaerolineae bacterium]|nr:hypothetical protein [Anaerolineae bacterium]